MKLTEYVESLDLKLHIYFGANQSGPWISNIQKEYGTVDFKNSSDDCMLRTATGWGKTPIESLVNLCKSLNEHKYIIINSNTEQRLQLPLPRLEL